MKYSSSHGHGRTQDQKGYNYKPVAYLTLLICVNHMHLIIVIFFMLESGA